MNLRQSKNLYLTLGLLILVFILPSIGYALDHFVENDPSAVPTYYWTAGCTPTSVSMMLGYYDWPRKSGGSTHQYGKLVAFYEERKNASRHQAYGGGNYHYDPGSGNSAGNDSIPNRIYTLAYLMGTDKDGGTPLKDIFGNPLTDNVKDAIEYVANTLYGYSFTAFQEYTESDWDMIWEKIKVEIDNNRPCVWGSNTPQMSGGLYAHAVCAIGYSDEGLIYFRNTWQPGYDSSYYDNFQTYSRIVGVTPGGGMWSDVQLTSPAGGESWGGNTIQQITWFNYYSLTPVTHAKLLYSVDGGHSWEDIVDTNTSGSSGSYSWRVPKDLDSTDALLKIEAYAGDAYAAGDGTEARLSFNASDANGAQVAIAHNYQYNTQGDAIFSGPVLMEEIWKWWMTNFIDIGEDVKNVKFTANCPYSVVGWNPRPSSENPPIYVWEYGVDIPEDMFYNTQGRIEPGVTLNLPVRMTRQVVPEVLEETVTIQTVTAELVFTSLPPKDANVWIGIPKDVLYQGLITTEIISQNDLSKWSEHIEGGTAGWWISHDDIELNTPYRFTAQVRSIKSPRIAGNPVWKPKVSIGMGNWIPVSPPPDGSSYTLSHPEGVIVTFESVSKIGWEPHLDAGGKGAAMERVMSEVPIAPLLDPIGGKVVSEGETLTFTVTATDPNTGDQLTYSASNLPLGAFFDPATRTFTWTPTYIQAGTYTNVHFVVTDSTYLSDSEDISIIVNDVIPPEIDILGNGISIPNGDTTPRAEDNTDFGNVDVDSGSITHEFTIQNTGGVNLVITGDPKVRIDNTTEFTVIAQPVSPIPAGGSSTFQIKFDPTSSGTHTATVRIYNNDSDESTYTFAIQGRSADFAFDPLPNPSSQTIVQGDSTSYAVSLKSIGGYGLPVSLVVDNISPWPGSGNPITCSFSPSALTPQDPPANATLNVTTTRFAVPRTYTIQVKGTDGAKTKYTSVELVVVPSILNGSISGNVYEEETDSFLDGVEVRAKEQFGDWQDRGSNTTVNGAYKIEGLMPGMYYIIGKKTGYGTAIKTDIPVSAGQNTQNQDLYMTNNPGWIYGTVKNTSSEPLGNVYVAVHKPGAEGRIYWMSGEDSSAGIGYYELEDLNAGNDYQIRTNPITINSVDYPAISIPGISVQKGQGTNVNIVLPEAARIYGTVKDGDGNPISNVRINWWVEGLGIGGRATSDENGYNLTGLLPGYTYIIEVYPPADSGFIIQRFEINIPTSGVYERNIVLESQAITISGKITSKATQQPVANISVECWNNDRELWRDTLTDSNGDYQITNWPKGESRLTVKPAHTYAAAGIEENFQSDVIRNFALDSESTLSGIVVDALTNTPIENVRVTLRNHSKNVGREVWTNSNGEFNLNGLPEGIAEVITRPLPDTQYNAKFYAWCNKYVYLGLEEHRTGFIIKLKEGALLEGDAKDASPAQNPIANEDVSVDGADGEETWTDTDQNGHYRLRVTPNTHVVYMGGVNEPDSGMVILPAEIDVLEPTGHHTVDFTVYNETTGSTMVGTVTTTAPKHEGSMFMVVAVESGQEHSIDTVYLMPTIKIDDLKEAGQYSLLLPPATLGKTYDIIFGVENEDENDIFSFTVRDQGLSLSSGSPGSTMAGPDFDYTSEGGTITGTVTYNGEPLLMANVVLTNQSGNFKGFAETDQNGIYHFYNVLAGDYSVQARHPDYGKSRVFPAGGVTDRGTISANIIMSDAQINLTQPNGGEIIYGGLLYDIKWTATGSVIDHIKLLWSFDGGSTYPEVIVANAPNTGVYTSIVPSYNSSTVKVKAIVEDAGNNPLAEDESDADFTIFTNQPPVLEPIGNKTVDEGTQLQFTISAADPDNDVLVYSATNLPQGATFNPETKTFSWTPTYEQAGIYTNVHFEVSDGTLSDSEDITITVNDVNRPPVFDPLSNQTVKEGQLLEFRVTATDPDNDVLKFWDVGSPFLHGATFIDNLFSWTPYYDRVGIYVVVFKVSDNKTTVSKTIRIVVRPNPVSKIYMIVPRVTRPGALIRIFGRGFGAYDITRSKVLFYNSYKSAHSDRIFFWSDRQIICRVPNLPGGYYGYGYYKVKVINRYGASTPFTIRILKR